MRAGATPQGARVVSPAPSEAPSTWAALAGGGEQRPPRCPSRRRRWVPSRGSWPAYEVPAAHRPPPPHRRRPSSPPRGRTLLHPPNQLNGGTLSSRCPRSAAWGNLGWQFYILLISFTTDPPKIPNSKGTRVTEGAGAWDLRQGRGQSEALLWNGPQTEGRPRPPCFAGGGPFFCGRCARASLGKPSWSGQAHPAVAAGPTLETRLRFPASRAPKA